MGQIKNTTILIYLFAIQEISKKRLVRNKDISAILNVNASSVTEMIKRLQEEGYLKESEISLTHKGEDLINKFKRKLI
ncbi:metal-dependent transcriptional regulator [Enterococcus gilvus]|uniref:metal-dependent transcriptional regulator n=1 Tax=Enterococcus gilvus TaxID=160453 RepID=UPI003ED8EE03